MARNNKRRTGKEANALGKMWIPVIDRELMRDEGLGLLSYWLDCWQTDPFGNRWTLMAYGEEALTELKSTTKAKYRKRLTQLGLFIFKEDKEGKQRSLYVLNLHGSRAISPETLLDASEQKLDRIEESLDENEKLLDGIEQKSRETLSYSAFENLSISDQYLFNNLSTCNKIENPGVSSFDDSLRSTEMAGYEEEKSSVPTKDLEVLQHPLSNEENLGSRPKTNKSSTKTTPNTEPSCSSSQKKSITSTEDDGSVELIRFRSPRDVNRAISPCDPCQRVERSEHAKTPQNDVHSHDNVRKLTAAPSSLAAPEPASAAPTTQSYFEVELGGVMPQQAWDYGEMECWEDLNDIQLEYRHETVMRLDLLTEWLKTHEYAITPDTLRFLYGLGSEGLLWYTYEVGGVPLDAIRVAYWFVVEGDELIAYIGKDHPSREIVCKLDIMK